MKLIIKFVKRNNAFVAIPRSFAQTLSQSLASREIASVLRLRTPEKREIYVSFNGLFSENEQDLEISHVFAGLNGLCEGDFVEVEGVAQSNFLEKFDFYCEELDYEIISLKSAEIEANLLNNTCVVFEKMRLPVYISQFNHVILEFSAKNHENLPYYSINPHAELRILAKTPEKSSKNSQIQQNPSVFLCKAMKLPGKFEESADFVENFMYVSEEIFKRYALSSDKPYLFEYKLVRKLRNFASFLRKLENSTKKDVKKPSKSPFFCFVRPLPQGFFFENAGFEELELLPYVYLSKKLRKMLKISRNSPVKLRFSEKITDFSRHKLMSFQDFCSPKSRISLYFFPLSARTHAEASRKRLTERFLSFFEEKPGFGAKKPAIFYSGQMLEICEEITTLKLVETLVDGKKTLLDMLALDFSSKNAALSQQQRENFEETLQNKLVLASFHDFLASFPEKHVEKHSLCARKMREMRTNSEAPAFFALLFAQELAETQRFLASFFQSRDFSQQKANVLLLTGPKGCGKSRFLAYLRENSRKFSFETVDFREITSLKQMSAPPLDFTKSFIEKKAQIASLKGPFAVLVLEFVELAAKNVERIDFQQNYEILVAEVMAKFVKDLTKKYANLVFFIVSEGKELLNAQLLQGVAKEIELKNPNFSQRKTVFEEIGKKFKHFPWESLEELVSSTENFSLRNFDLLYNRSCAAQEASTLEVSQIFKENIQNIANKTFKSNKNYPKFEHIGGLTKAKELIRDTFEIPQKFAFLFKNIPIKMSNGILLYGPPGCGKTFLAAASANELSMNFFSVKGPELLNKYIGASEQAVRDIFEKASEMKPSIVFFDEFDAIVPKRNSGSTNVTDRVVNQFLCYLDGVASLQGVYILAASSRPDLIDPALLRPGRIDKHIYLGFPEHEDRQEILSIYYKSFKFLDVSAQEIAEKTQGFTASDLVALLREMQITKAHVLLEKAKSQENSQVPNEFEVVFSRKDFEETLEKFRPALSSQDIKRYEKMYADFLAGGVDIKKQKTTLY